MTRAQRLILASTALLATLSGCHHEEKAIGHGTISGEILPGTVSDAMLPYDALKSKAPLAPAEAIDTSMSTASAKASDTGDTDAAAAAPPPARTPDAAAADTEASPAAASN